MNREELKERVCRAIDAHRDEIVALGEDIRVHPELGYKEHRTAALVEQHFTGLGLKPTTGLAITGSKTVFKGRSEGPTVAYLSELDSVLVKDHPDADPETGAAHACGHNAQIANLVALAYGFAESGVMDELDGNLALMSVPAEEYVEVAYRLGLRNEGKIEFLGGKPEMIQLGAFDDVDLCLATHQSSAGEGSLFSVGGPSNGCVVKQIRYTGKAAHAGGSPHAGINALKAAMLGLQAIDANRETFKDSDHIRVHPIITKGGELVNVIPADVRMETYVRGATVPAILEAAAKVDRSLKAGALAMGAKVRIETLPGYLPKLVSDELVEVYKRNVITLVGEDGWSAPERGFGSTDIGDLSHIMPAIEATARGCAGTAHGADYRVVDEDMAYMAPARAAAMTIIDLLIDGATQARSVIEAYHPPMTKESYLSFMRNLYVVTDWDGAEQV